MLARTMRRTRFADLLFWRMFPSAGPRIIVSMASSEQKNSIDAVIAVYAKDIDTASLRENLRLTPQERSEKFLRAMKMVFELRRNATNG